MLYDDENTVSFAKGDVIFLEGTEAKYAYIVISGAVELSTRSDGKKKVVEVKKKNAIFGEMALFDISERLFTATALEDSVCRKVDYIYLETQMDKSSPFIVALLKMMVSTIKRLSH